MATNEKAVFLIEEILENDEKLFKTVFKNYKGKDRSLREGFEKIAQVLEAGEVDLTAREELALKLDERFGSTICASHLIERGFVDGHENYEYEWYLHIDYDQKKEEYLELFINRVLIDTVSLAIVIQDYTEENDPENLILSDPIELVESMEVERYRELLGEILGDSDKRIQAIMKGEPSSEDRLVSHEYISTLYGGVSEKELVDYALKATVAADDYVLIALDQKIKQVMKVLADKDQEKEMKILMGLGYLLELYDINFELTQTSCVLEL